MFEPKRDWPRLFLGGLLACVWVAVTCASAAEGPAAPTNLRCEYLSNPLGIDVPQPRFSWVLEHSARGEMQTAYQVLVATRAES